jgi:hypothetical protein
MGTQMVRNRFGKPDLSNQIGKQDGGKQVQENTFRQPNDGKPDGGKQVEETRFRQPDDGKPDGG